MRAVLASVLFVLIVGGLSTGSLRWTTSVSAQTSPTGLERIAQAIDRFTRAQEEHTRELRNLKNTVNGKCR